MSTPESIEIFISYSHKDEELKNELYIHLAGLRRQGKITSWQDRDIEAGEEWDIEIKARLESAKIILLLITPKFIASDSCFDKEMQRAMERHAAGSARVIPIIMKPCDWQSSPFGKLQVLPKDAKPVTRWEDQDEALLNAVLGVRRVVKSMQHKASKPSVYEMSHPTSILAPHTNTPSAPVAANSFQQRAELFQLLSGLPGPQFEQVIFLLKPSTGNVPPASAAQGQRVPALLEWAESSIGCGLEKVEQAISIIINP